MTVPRAVTMGYSGLTQYKRKRVVHNLGCKDKMVIVILLYYLITLWDPEGYLVDILSPRCDVGTSVRHIGGIRISTRR